MDKNAYLDEQLEKLGSRIRDVRISLGYRTQYTFLKIYTGSPKRSSIISRLEKGVNIDFSTAIHLVRAFQINLVSLFDFNDQFELVIYKDKGSFSDRMSGELKSLGKRINKIRKNAKLKLADANDVGISEAKLSLYENGKESIEFESLATLSNWLGVEIWELFWNGEKEKEKKKQKV